MAVFEASSPIQGMIFAEVGCMLADMPTFRKMLGCKGHSGHMLCCLCRNATNRAIAGTPLHFVCADVVPINVVDFDMFIKHTDDTIKEVLRRLHAHHETMLARGMAKGQFDCSGVDLGRRQSHHCREVQAEGCIVCDVRLGACLCERRPG